MSREGIIDYRHPWAGFALPLPLDWERAEDPEPGVALIAVEPEYGAGFRANVVAVVEPLSPALDLETWQAGIDEHFPDMLPEYLLIDRELTQLDGRDAIRRVAHYVDPRGSSTTVEQWSAIHAGRGYTLTATAATVDFIALDAIVAGIAEEFHIDAESPPPERAP